MHLKEVIAKNKLAEFAAEHGKKYPRASKKHFHALLKAAALGIVKPNAEAGAYSSGFQPMDSSAVIYGAVDLTIGSHTGQ
jgi:hypothetical protein